jgi:PncC family amidohydrolase
VPNSVFKGCGSQLIGLVEHLKDLLKAKNLTVATAESCTGGLLAGALTDVAGSSAYMLGGVVSYANDAKVALLGVNPATLEEVGAVSEEVARQMARGARERLGSDVAISVTGVAGPDGGSPDKPVGLIWIGLSDGRGERAERYLFDSANAPDGVRARNRALTVEAALKMLIAWAEAQ